MKTVYLSEVTGKYYNTVEELQKAEKEADKKKRIIKGYK